MCTEQRTELEQNPGRSAVCATGPTRLCLLIVRTGVLGSAQARVDYIALELGRVNLWGVGKVVLSCGIPVVAHAHEGRGAGEGRALWLRRG